MLRILHLEDEPADAHLVLDVLREEGLEVESDRVDTLEEFKALLASGSHALVLSDYTMPGVDAFETLRLARQVRPEVPFVFLSGTLGEDVAIETLKMGATDYVLKQRLNRLGPAIRRALREAEDQRRRQQAEEALRQANTDLERKVQERTAQLLEANSNLQTFANAAAHDLRSPLRTIRSFTGLALEEFGPLLDPECRLYIERVAQAAGTMERLMSDLLDYSRMEQAEFRLARVSLQDATDEVLALLEEDIREKSGVVRIEGTLPDVVGHRATVVLIVSNFVANALKFVADGVQPHVKICAEVPADDQQGRKRVRLWVNDNGIGIRRDDVPKLFGMFQRLHGKEVYPGTGLGLAIARRGAERMGGGVGVESEPGRGSRFWFELPKA